MDMNKIFEAKYELEKELTFEEICKLFREIVYEKVSYYNSDNKGVIYDGTYSDTNIEQATRIQQKISCYVSLFEQVIDDRREFSEEYLASK